jgi:hypothetical protein
VSEEKSELIIDYDAIWSAISRSTTLQRILADVAKQIAEEAETLARAVAYDEGYYADSFEYGTDNAATVRNKTNSNPLARRNRARRNQRGTNRYLDTVSTGVPDAVNYQGQIGIVVNTDFKAAWVEYGSIAKGPRRVMTTAGESVAQKVDAEFELLYDNTHQANPGELGKRISKGKTGGGA